MTILEQLFGSRLRAKLLSWLILHRQERFWVRQLEALIEEDSSNLSRELARLEGMGIVFSQVEGRQKYYQIARECPIYEDLRGLVLKTSGLAGQLREALAGLESQIDIAMIFGSLAAGQEGADSDIDLLVVGEVSFAEISDALTPLEATVGREVNPVVYPPTELRAKLTQRQAFLTNVLAGPKLFVIGDQDELERLGEGRVAAST